MPLFSRDGSCLWRALESRDAFLPDYRLLDKLGRVVQREVHLIGQHLEPAARAVELLVGRHPEGVEGAGDHRHERPLLQPVDGVGGDGGDARLVGLGVGHAEVVNTLQVINPAELYPHLICFSFSKLVKDWLNDGVILEVERLLERTGGQAEADDGGQQQVVQQSVTSGVVIIHGVSVAVEAN